MKKKFAKIDLSLVSIPLISVLCLSCIFLIFPNESKNFLVNIRAEINKCFSGYYLWVGILFLLSTLVLAFSPLGDIKIGKKEDKPMYPDFKWGMMIFTSTMSADVIFYSLCEWMMYISEPTIQSKKDPFEWSLTYSLFHWGPIAWSFYIMLAVAFGYMLYVSQNKKQKFSEACRPIFGNLIDGLVGKVIDLIAIFSLVAATATTFSMSLPLLAQVAKTLFHIGTVHTWSLILMAVIVIIYLSVSLLGLKAMSRFSVIAFSMFGLLLIYVLIISEGAQFDFTAGTAALKNLTTNFISMALPKKIGSFTQNWTVYYWSYWIVWCVATPFFIGGISKGKKIREIVLGAYFWGLSGTFLSFIILSNFGIGEQIKGIINITSLLSKEVSYPVIITTLFKTLPNYQWGLLILSGAMIGLYCTVFDSITMVISKYSYKNLLVEENPSKKMRGFWAIAFSIFPLAIILTGESVYNIQSVAIIAALPTSLVMILIVVSFYKSLMERKRK
ncbi:BCCT family transporter [Lactobacillus johnsonii]|uniref:BCCT family transporter n=1 Tax=Lactobacillus johnsonii TaxID=33959 RepID=UPI001435102C|nr:BCCT family transporter [Lactobacillus johnsonii]GFI20582.1 glycine betaine transporter OpuD [Lactobacillus johnsonii]